MNTSNCTRTCRYRKDGGSKEKKNKDLWVKLLEARVKAKKAREQKIDEDLDKLLSGEAKEEGKSADGEEGKTEEGDAAKAGDKPADAKPADGQPPSDAAKETDKTDAGAKAAVTKEKDNLETNADKCKENILLFVGSKDSGKSTQVQLFLSNSKKDSKPKPTTALEYTFGRK